MVVTRNLSSMVVMIALMIAMPVTALAATITLEDPEDGAELYYRSDAKTSFSFDFDASGFYSLSDQLTKCDVEITKGTRTVTLKCDTAMKDNQRYTITVSDLLSEMETQNDPEGTYVFEFEMQWVEEEETDGDLDTVDDEEEDDTTSTTAGQSTQEVTIVLDDTNPDKVGTLDEPIVGEESLTVIWPVVTKDENGDDEPGSVLYDVCASETAGVTSLSDCGSSAENIAGTEDGDKRTFKIEGLTNGTIYYVKVRAHDKAGNVGIFSEEMSGIPQPVADFWEYYKQNGGKEEGGFCFIATEVFGDYDHPTVRVLRDFRDKILMNVPFGTDFIAWYYSNGPKMASFIRKHESLRPVVKLGLLPLAGGTLLMLSPIASWQGILCMGLLIAAFMFFRRRRASRMVGMMAVSLLAASMLLTGFANTARAEEDGVSSEEVEAESTRIGSFSVSGGMMGLDSIDNGVAGNPANKIFGGDGEFIFQLSYDQMLYHSKPAGAVMLGASFHYWKKSGSGVFVGGALDGTTSETDGTSMQMIPLRLYALYRVEQLDKYFNVPLVPYAKIGLNYYIWWIKDNHDSVAEYTDPNTGDSYDGYGGTFGWDVSVGVLLSLNFLDSGMATTFDMEYGINNTYLYFEYIFAFVDDFGSDSSFDLSNQYWLTGIAFDF